MLIQPLFWGRYCIGFELLLYLTIFVPHTGSFLYGGRKNPWILDFTGLTSRPHCMSRELVIGKCYSTHLRKNRSPERQSKLSRASDTWRWNWLLSKNPFLSSHCLSRKQALETCPSYTPSHFLFLLQISNK